MPPRYCDLLSALKLAFDQGPKLLKLSKTISVVDHSPPHGNIGADPYRSSERFHSEKRAAVGADPTAEMTVSLSLYKFIYESS